MTVLRICWSVKMASHLYSTPFHWLVHGYMTSNNVTDDHQSAIYKQVTLWKLWYNLVIIAILQLCDTGFCWREYSSLLHLPAQMLPHFLQSSKESISYFQADSSISYANSLPRPLVSSIKMYQPWKGKMSLFLIVEKARSMGIPPPRRN